MNIGLLEDNLAIQELVKTTLELNGHTVFTYTQGRPLLNSLFEKQDGFLNYPCISFHPSVSFRYDLLIIDLNLPDELSGTDVIAAIYTKVSPSVLPIIVVSAANTEQLSQLHKRFPTLSIIRKPFALKALLQMINSFQNKSTDKG